VTPLLGQARTLGGPVVEVGQMPELITSSEIP
jgi:hypothetical protein